MKLTKTEAALLLPIGQTEFAGTVDELMEEVKSAYYALDDAPYPYWERRKQQNILERLAAKHGVEIDI